jgi:hypothetical protein
MVWVVRARFLPSNAQFVPSICCICRAGWVIPPRIDISQQHFTQAVTMPPRSLSRLSLNLFWDGTGFRGAYFAFYSQIAFFFGGRFVSGSLETRPGSDHDLNAQKTYKPWTVICPEGLAFHYQPQPLDGCPMFAGG